MFLQSLTLRQFRNHENTNLDVPSRVNLFIGPNGAGKTNLIEAIAVLASGVSPRGADSESMVQWGKDGFALVGTFQPEVDQADPITLEMKYRKGGPRNVRQNGQEPVRLRDLIGRVPLVSFVPEDLALVKGDPDGRRRAVNMVLAQVDGLYAESLRRYNEALRSRNAALRQIADGILEPNAIDPWDDAVIREGLQICQKRSDFVQDFSERVSAVQRRISNEQDQVTLDYHPSFAGPWDETAPRRWKQLFQRMRPQEVALGVTLTGPQRDDIIFNHNGRLARSFASEGQLRTSAVAFKLAEIPYMEEKCGQKPICLLDDVLSELDAMRAKHLLNELSSTGQCFVTMTGLESWPADQMLPATIYYVDDAGVRSVPSRQGEHAVR